jgi:hypothetical protein
MRFLVTPYHLQAGILAGCLCGAFPLAAQGRGGAAKGHSIKTPPAAAESRGRSMEHRSPSTPSRQMRVSEHLASNEKLVTRLQPLFPQGTNVTEASSGFKNAGQFVAAARASKNLGIPFADLKTQMTGPANGSLGKAIKSLKPDMPESDVKEAVKRAEKAAKEDMAETR